MIQNQFRRLKCPKVLKFKLFLNFLNKKFSRERVIKFNLEKLLLKFYFSGACLTLYNFIFSHNK